MLEQKQRRDIITFAVAITVAIAVWMITRSTDPDDETAAPSVRSQTPTVHPAPWNDRADRTDRLPAGHIPAWQVNPPRPLGDPPSAIPARDAIAEPPRTVDGARPPRPVPGT